MIEGNFLRRIELNPSNDLINRRDLLEYQTTKSLDPIDWEPLTHPKDGWETAKFREQHNNFLNWYMRHISVADPTPLLMNFELPPGCKNRIIHRLCMINRIRYEVNYPLLYFKESEWVKFIIYFLDPLFRDGFNEYFTAKAVVKRK